MRPSPWTSSLALAVGLSLLFTQPLFADDDSPPPQATEVDRPESRDDSTSTNSSLTQSLQGESGISVQTMCTNCNSADLSVGAFGNDFVSMICDGLPVPAGLAQIYILSVMPPTMIDNVDVDKGAGDVARAGGLIGGEIDVRRKIARRGLELNAATDAGEHGWRSARADLTGGTGWFAGALAVSAAQSNEVDDDEDGTPDMAAIDRTTVEGRVELSPGQHRIRTGLTHYDEVQENGRAAYDFLSSGPFFLDRDVWNLENVDLKRTQIDATYDFTFRNGAGISAALVHADREMLVDETLLVILDTFEPAYDIEERQRHARLSAFVPVGPSTGFRFGATRTEQRYDVEDFKNLQQGRETLTEDGLWAEAEWSVSGQVNATAGVRRAEFAYEDAETRPPWLAVELPEGARWLPRGTLSWTPADSLRLRFSAGRGYRQPPPSYEEVCCGRRYRGNRGVRMEKSRVLGLETTWQPSPSTQLNASAFFTRYEDLILKMVSQSNQSQPLYQNVNMPRARSESFSVEARLEPWDWLGVRMSASWTRARNHTSGDEIPALLDTGAANPVPSVLVSADVPYLPDSTANLGLQFLPPRTKLTIDLSIQHAGPQTIQNFDPAVFDPITGDNLDFVRTPSHRIYNLRVSRELGAGLALFLGADNLGDYLQEDLADPTTDTTWGPLRGRYVYGGLTYRFARAGS